MTASAAGFIALRRNRTDGIRHCKLYRVSFEKKVKFRKYPPPPLLLEEEMTPDLSFVKHFRQKAPDNFHLTKITMIKIRGMIFATFLGFEVISV